MADEPDNLVLKLLREMRTEIREIRSTQAEHTQKLDLLEKQGEEGRQYLAHALGLSTMNEMKLRAVDLQHMDFETRQKKTGEILADLQRRMSRLEETTE